MAAAKQRCLSLDTLAQSGTGQGIILHGNGYNMLFEFR
jgi:hypothetical protein